MGILKQYSPIRWIRIDSERRAVATGLYLATPRKRRQKVLLIRIENMLYYRIRRTGRLTNPSQVWLHETQGRSRPRTFYSSHSGRYTPRRWSIRLGNHQFCSRTDIWLNDTRHTRKKGKQQSGLSKEDGFCRQPDLNV